MSSTLLATTIAFSLFSLTSAHFMIQNPAPIPGSAPKDPLAGSGSDFPCHSADLFNVGSRTSMAVGPSQLLEFNLGSGANTAVHGGGSCQLSLTYEKNPEKLKDPASWKVIYSIVEGCPTNYWWNLDTAKRCVPGSGDIKCVNAFDFTIPPGVKNGDAIFAWTWFNNLGEREMYMNCAAVSITGGQD
ncbi:hypothetical protein P152DRAFT_482190 [Eremomyces bilateralis CBS 781.70]|uniref:Chitin-binding type-4 domain-containing protein n=1 Tax=Eremomyces bilateralis CBS 781.70 TaxID=1392243 RepID=A0A6G1G3N4_9PEZI|nr:uncharacterized protein P152DRAFT_482190 [Eremomyces bilateralis CBS 781.70]KAF1812727.1 hypothetical protein P152DRAFT_482190 [Eremomyces bilateralis CBS 781.70]